MRKIDDDDDDDDDDVVILMFVVNMKKGGKAREIGVLSQLLLFLNVHLDKEGKEFRNLVSGFSCSCLTPSARKLWKWDEELMLILVVW